MDALGIIFASYLAAGLPIVAAVAAGLLLILGLVVYDDYRGHTLDHGGKWLALAILGGISAYFVSFSTVSIASVAITFGIGALITVLLKVVEGVYVSRGVLATNAVDIREELTKKLRAWSRACVEQYASYADENGVGKTATPIAWLFGGSVDIPDGRKIRGRDYDQSQIARLIGIMTAVPGFSTFWQSVDGSLNSRVEEKYIESALFQFLATNADKFLDDKFDVEWLLSHEVFQEQVRQRLVQGFRSNDYYHRTNILMNAILRPTTKPLVENYVQTVLNVDFHKGRVSGLFFTWVLFWPFYLINLILGRLLINIGDLFVSFIRKFSLNFLNRFIFNDIA